MNYFKKLRFKWCILRARLKEIVSQDFAGAAEILARCNPPPRGVALRDAYRLRMLVLSSAPERAVDVLNNVDTFYWFESPSSDTEKYAAAYCKYMIAALTGDVETRRALEQELQKLSVPSIYRDALKVS